MTRLARLSLDHNDITTGFMVGRTARMADWAFRKEQQEFERVIAVLRAKKWANDNRERYQELQRIYAKRHAPALVVKVRGWRHRRHKETAAVFTCRSPECSVQWCRVPFGKMNGNNRPGYCSKQCANRARYLRGMNGGWAKRAAVARAAKRAGGQHDAELRALAQGRAA